MSDQDDDARLSPPEACLFGDSGGSGLTGVGLHGGLEVGCHDLLELSERQAVDVEATRAVGPRGQLAVPVAAQPTVLARRLLEPDQLPCRCAQEAEGGGELVEGSGRVPVGYGYSRNQLIQRASKSHACRWA